MTVHAEVDGHKLRLWSLDDGRCIMISPFDLTKDKKIIKLYALNSEAFPGWVMCACESKEIMIINVYSMTFVKAFALNYENLLSFQVINK